MATTQQKINTNASKAHVAQPAMEKNAVLTAAVASVVNANLGRHVTPMVCAKKEMPAHPIAPVNSAARMGAEDSVEFAMPATNAHKANVLIPIRVHPNAMVKHVAQMGAAAPAAHVKPMKSAKVAHVRNLTVHRTA